ncbi:MAG: NADH-quinone oxidoreductase subunit D [Chloroflexi bacterium]|nr:NADH-quinone oxidoreductase subunit D [Chloroflexota bacterium]
MKTETFMVNMGPQHPSTHGVFRMRLSLDGEVVVDVEPIFGYLHRGVEKLAEGRTWVQDVTLTDRLDYLASMSNNLAYVLAVEKLAGIAVPERAEHIRVIMAELSRIASHLMAVGSFLNDMGAATFTPLIYMFQEREKILDLFEMTCGQRMTFNYIRIGGVSCDLPEGFIPALTRFLGEMPRFIDEYDTYLEDNEILLARCVGVGVLPPDKAINASVSGPSLRGSGVRWDLRQADPYSIYDRLKFDIPTGKNGDVYDRYRVRMEEMRQSLRILGQSVRDLPGGDYRTKVPVTFRAPAGEAYAHLESPKGELGFYLVSDGSLSPYRFKIRAPSFINLGVLRDLLIGCKVADCVVTLGSLDIIMGEVDR